MKEEQHKADLIEYQNMKTELIQILYEEDPEGFGSSVFSPEDEYSEEAARLIVRLRAVKSQVDIE